MCTLKYCFSLYFLLYPTNACLLKKKDPINEIHHINPGPWNDAAEPSLARANCDCGDFGSKTSPSWILFISFLPDVKLRNGDIHGCIGTIITSNLIATSHNCIQPETEIIMNVFEQWPLRKSAYNSSILSKTELIVSSEPYAEGEFFQIEKIILNGYHIINRFWGERRGTVDNKNDILLLKVKADFTTHKFHKPICIPDNDKFDFFGKKAIFFGRGGGDHPNNNIDGTKAVVKHLDNCIPKDRWGNEHMQENKKTETKHSDPMCINHEQEKYWSYLILSGGPLVFKSVTNGAYFLAGVMGLRGKGRSSSISPEQEGYGYALFANILGMRKLILHRAKQHRSRLCRKSTLKLSNKSSEIIIIDDVSKVGKSDCILDIKPPWWTADRGRSQILVPNVFTLTTAANEEFYSLDVGWDGKCFSVDKQEWKKAKSIEAPEDTCINLFSNEDCTGQYATLLRNEGVPIKRYYAVGWTVQSVQGCTERLGGKLSEINFFSGDKTLIHTSIRKDICGCVNLPSAPQSVVNNGNCIWLSEDADCRYSMNVVFGGNGKPADDLTTDFRADPASDSWVPFRELTPIKSFSLCGREPESCYKLHVVVFKVLISEITDETQKHKSIIHTTTILNQNSKSTVKKEKGAKPLTESIKTTIIESVTGIYTAGIAGIQAWVNKPSWWNNGNKIRTYNEYRIVEGIRQAYEKKVHSNSSLDNGKIKVNKTRAMYYNGQWNVSGCSKYEGNVAVWTYDFEMTYETQVMVYVTVNCKIQDRSKALEMLPKDLEVVRDDGENVVIARARSKLSANFAPDRSDTVLSGTESSLSKYECK